MKRLWNYIKNHNGTFYVAVAAVILAFCCFVVILVGEVMAERDFTPVVMVVTATPEPAVPTIAPTVVPTITPTAVPMASPTTIPTIPTNTTTARMSEADYAGILFAQTENCNEASDNFLRASEGTDLAAWEVSIDEFRSNCRFRGIEDRDTVPLTFLEINDLELLAGEGYDKAGFYMQKGVDALQAGDLATAEVYFDQAADEMEKVTGALELVVDLLKSVYVIGTNLSGCG